MTSPAPEPQQDPNAPPKHAAPDSDGATPPDDDQLGEGGKKALAAERKRASDLEKELARYRKAEQDRADADKTELQKAADRAERAEKAAAEAAAKALRLEVAAEKGLNAKQAARLQGATREELEADADELLESFPSAPPAKGTPKPDPSQGSKTQAPQRARSLTEAIAASFASNKASGG
jgi:hypothetical protein